MLPVFFLSAYIEHKQPNHFQECLCILDNFEDFPPKGDPIYKIRETMYVGHPSISLQQKQVQNLCHAHHPQENGAKHKNILVDKGNNNHHEVNLKNM
jgi:hypothetical protein